MKVKTYIFANMKDGIEQIKEEYGPDAIILDMKQFPEGSGKKGCEISVAANEVNGSREDEGDMLRKKTEEAWSSVLTRLNEKLANMESEFIVERVKTYPLPLRILFDRMSKSGFDVRSAFSIISEVYGEIGTLAENSSQATFFLRAVFEKKIKTLDIRDTGDPVLLVGPSGVGKTQTAKKLARLLAVKNAPVSILAYDPVKKGAYDELLSYSEKTGIPFAFATDVDDLVYFAGKDNRKKIIDIAGNLAVQKEICAKLNGVRKLVVLPAGARDDKIPYYCGHFKEAVVSGLIFTKVDEEERLGHVSHNLMKADYPVCFITFGPGVEDIIVPDDNVFFRMMLGLYDVPACKENLRP